MSAPSEYAGHRTSAEDADAHSSAVLNRCCPSNSSKRSSIWRSDPIARLYAPWTESYAGQLRARYPFREVAEATPLITKLSVKKSAAEIAAIQHATDVRSRHTAQHGSGCGRPIRISVAATLLNTFLDRGCEGPAYSPIVGSGPNSTILHYMSNQRRMDRGELVVMDAAAAVRRYASDITRTAPVGGKFTPRQREIYQTVLGAQRAAIAAVKPGGWFVGPGETLTKIARDYIGRPRKGLCMASRSANISRTTSGIRWAWRCTIRDGTARSKPAW